jgi:putative NADH-flavin reductase
MNLTIVAATGRIGRHLMTQALDGGHRVTAVVRNAAALPAATRTAVRVVAVDLRVPDPAALRTALAGADAVISGLGPRTRADAGVTEPGTRAIVDAMRAVGGRRIVVVSAAPVGTVPSPGRPDPPRHDPGDGLLMRHVLVPIVRTVFRAHYEDLARMEDVLRDSGLDWTVVRPPRLTNGPLTRAYRTAYGRNLPRGLTVSRADVAACMLRAVEQPGSVHQTIGIAT